MVLDNRNLPVIRRDMARVKRIGYLESESIGLNDIIYLNVTPLLLYFWNRQCPNLFWIPWFWNDRP